MAITSGTKAVLDSSGNPVTVKTINDSADTTTSPAHGLIDGVTGSLYSPIPTANNSSAYAHTAVTTAYAFGQAWLNNATAGSVTFPTVTIAKANDQAFSAIYFRLQKSGTVITNAVFRIHFSNTLPTTSVADYGALITGLSMGSGYLGYVDFTVGLPFADFSWGIGSIPASALSGKPVSGAQTLYWVPEVRAAYTPISAETLTLYEVTQ